MVPLPCLVLCPFCCSLARMGDDLHFYARLLPSVRLATLM